MNKFSIIQPPVIVDAVQFRKNKKLPESEYFQIHFVNGVYIFACVVFQKELNDKDWIIRQKDGHHYIVDDVYFKQKFRKVIEVKEKKLKVIDVH